MTAAIAADTVSSHDADYDYDPPVAGSYVLPVIKVAPDGAIIDSDSKSLNLRELTHGRITVLSFIYTRCAAPKACPYATGVLTQIHDLSDDELAELVLFIEKQLPSDGPIVEKDRWTVWSAVG